MTTELIVIAILLIVILIESLVIISRRTKYIVVEYLDKNYKEILLIHSHCFYTIEAAVTYAYSKNIIYFKIKSLT